MSDPVTRDDLIEAATEAAYWEMDAREHGAGRWKGSAISGRDAFKQVARNLIALAEQGEFQPAQPENPDLPKFTIVAGPEDRGALDVQIAGSHYKDLKIQPVEFIHANGLGFLEGCIVKRITRWRSKDGVKDLEKIKHEVDLLIELEGLKK